MPHDSSVSLGALLILFRDMVVKVPAGMSSNSWSRGPVGIGGWYRGAENLLAGLQQTTCLFRDRSGLGFTSPILCRAVTLLLV